jgi:MazG family protein
MAEELGDLLLQVVFHAQMAKERGVFDFEKVCRALTEKLIRRHPHVFGTTKVKNVDEVWANWEKIKRAEKAGTKNERKSALDGIPKHLPALLRAEKLLKKARKSKLFTEEKISKRKFSKTDLAKELFELASFAQLRGWCAEELLAGEIRKRERELRRKEKTGRS